MQDFLKDRPVLDPQQTKLVIAPPATPSGGPATPFARILRDAAAVAPRPAANDGRAPAPAAGATAAAKAEHTSKVQPIVENGRVTRLVVTCSCGKVTEIACTY